MLSWCVGVLWETHSESWQIKTRVRNILFALVAVLLGLVLIEGFVSVGLGLFGMATEARKPLAERHHTTYDAELGWVNKPSTFLKDLYGPGRSLTINSQGFRARRDYAPQIPQGKVRILSSGDSFTLGFGVDDQDTWCARLEVADPRLEVVNMGQGGYGIDQMYLWYERDGRTIAHDIHLFAFITDDFNRMRYDRFLGYGKPTLRLERGVPVAQGVPVKERSFYVPWFTQNAKLLQRFATVELFAKIAGAGGTAGPEPVLSADEAVALAFHSMVTMHRRDIRHGSRLVVVWLPLKEEYRNRENDESRMQLLRQLRSQGILTIDLVEPMRMLSPEHVETLFLTSLPEDALTDFVNASLHYSRFGNTFFAGEMLARLRAMPGMEALQ